MVVPITNSIYADSSYDNALPVCDLFHNFRPDVAVVIDREIHAWELTILLLYEHSELCDICQIGTMLIVCNLMIFIYPV